MINQSNYIPWKGYIDAIAQVDEFIVYDSVQYTKNDWRNRNKIKTPRGTDWLTIPVLNNFGQSIKDAIVSVDNWGTKHLKTLSANYSKASFFKEVYPIIESWYKEIQNEKKISKINVFFLEKILSSLKINTAIIKDDDLLLEGSRNERLLNICQQRGATDYFSGPAAKCYLDVDTFEKEGIKVHWFDYSSYNKYDQCWDGFEHGVSILDMLFNLGFKKAKSYLKHGN